MMNERILDAVQRPPLKGFSGFSFAEDGIVIGLFFIHMGGLRGAYLTRVFGRGLTKISANSWSIQRVR